MGNCSSAIDCTSFKQPLTADPDVSGLGVVVSFIATALLTFGAIINGYLSDSLPDTTLNRLDRFVLGKLAQTCRTPWQRIKVALGQAHFTQRQPPDPTAVRTARKRRQDALRRFVLALSDQQLVTGLAILIAGYIKRCSMSQYHFNIVKALAWFSSTIHLSTLTVLRDYLTDHPVVRTWRVIGMVCMVALLYTAEFMPSSTQRITEGLDNSMPIQCVFNKKQIGNDFWSILTLPPIQAFLLVSYGNKVFHLYYFNSNVSIMGWFIRQIKKGSRASVNQLKELAETVLEADERPKLAKSAAYRKLQENRRDSRLIHRLNALSKSQRPRPSLRRGLALIHFIFAELSDCFLYQILFLLFGITYGLVQIAACRWAYMSAPADIIGSENEMGFGQLVPLLLITLPILAAGEAYFALSEARDSGPDTVYRPSYFLSVVDGQRALSSQIHLQEVDGTAASNLQPVTQDFSSHKSLHESVEHQTLKPVVRVDTEFGLTPDAAGLSHRSISSSYEAQGRPEAATASGQASGSRCVVDMLDNENPYSYPGLIKYLACIIVCLIVFSMLYAFSLTTLTTEFAILSSWAAAGVAILFGAIRTISQLIDWVTDNIRTHKGGERSND